VATIAHHVGLSRQGVYNYLKMKQPPERTRINQPCKLIIEPYKDYLVKRWNEGCRNAQQVYREIKEQGYTGSDQSIVRYFAQFRTQKDAGNASLNHQKFGRASIPLGRFRLVRLRIVRLESFLPTSRPVAIR
jgi:hypothetical protein